MADTPARSNRWKKWAAGLLLAALAAVSGLSAGSQTPPFSDVDQSHPRYQDIFHAAEQGWFQGYPDGTFQPDRPITPTQLARIIERARSDLTRSGAAVFLRAGVHALQTGGVDVTDTTLPPLPETEPDSTEEPFSDVDESHVLYPEIAYTASQGWFQGYPDGTFQPDRPITPDQTARIIERAQPNLTRSAAAVFLRAGIHALRLADILVTDTTLAPPPEPASALAAGQAEPTTTTTTTVPFVVVTRPPAPPRVSHPTWDSRLPSTWDGITATECNNTLRYPVIDDPPAWDYWYNIHGGHFVLPEESWVIAEALKNPSFEPASGTVEHTAITNLGLTSAQDIRGIGEGAADVRWYALSIKNTIINREGDLEHPSCASILAGANAVLNAPYTTTTTRAGS